MKPGTVFSKIYYQPWHCEPRFGGRSNFDRSKLQQNVCVYVFFLLWWFWLVIGGERFFFPNITRNADGISWLVLRFSLLGGGNPNDPKSCQFHFQGSYEPGMVKVAKCCYFLCRCLPLGKKGVFLKHSSGALNPTFCCSGKCWASPVKWLSCKWPSMELKGTAHHWITSWLLSLEMPKNGRQWRA